MPSNLKIIKTAIFISGRGSNMKSLIKYSKKKNSKIEITKVFSNNKTAKGIETATKLNVPEIFYYSKKSFEEKIKKNMNDWIKNYPGFLVFGDQDHFQYKGLY